MFTHHLAAVHEYIAGARADIAARTTFRLTRPLHIESADSTTVRYRTAGEPDTVATKRWTDADEGFRRRLVTTDGASPVLFLNECTGEPLAHRSLQHVKAQSGMISFLAGNTWSHDDRHVTGPNQFACKHGPIVVYAVGAMCGSGQSDCGPSARLSDGLAARGFLRHLVPSAATTRGEENKTIQALVKSTTEPLRGAAHQSVQRICIFWHCRTVQPIAVLGAIIMIALQTKAAILGWVLGDGWPIVESLITAFGARPVAVAIAQWPSSSSQ